MNSPIVGLRVASVVFGLMCLGQLLRIITCVEIIAGGHHISRRISAVAVVVTGALCVWLWLLASKAGKPEPATAPGKP